VDNVVIGGVVIGVVSLASSSDAMARNRKAIVAPSIASSPLPDLDLRARSMASMSSHLTTHSAADRLRFTTNIGFHSFALRSDCANDSHTLTRSCERRGEALRRSQGRSDQKSWQT